METTKLYVVVRADLDRGAQLAQCGHAVAAFAYYRSRDHADWVEGSNNIVVLSARDERHLRTLWGQLVDLPAASFTEPDLDDQMTAFAVLGQGGVPYLSSLPLAPKAA